MEFNEKLQQLRKEKGLTQEQLAEILFVSRTAVSKWESGRGYPSIESLKAISKYFNISVDELLSGNELISLAEDESKEKARKMGDLVYGILDCMIALFFVLPIFGQEGEEIIRSVSLIAMNDVGGFIKPAYMCMVTIITIFGLLELIMQFSDNKYWIQSKSIISIVLTIIITLFFIISRQPYAGAYSFGILVAKGAILLKKQ